MSILERINSNSHKLQYQHRSIGWIFVRDTNKCFRPQDNHLASYPSSSILHNYLSILAFGVQVLEIRYVDLPSSILPMHRTLFSSYFGACLAQCLFLRTIEENGKEYWDEAEDCLMLLQMDGFDLIWCTLLAISIAGSWRRM